MSKDLVYVAHPEPAIAARLGGGLEAAQYEVVSMSSVDEAREITSNRQFHIPDAILTPLGDLQSGDSILITLYQSNPLMEQIPLVVVAANQGEERREALRMGLLSVVLPPYDSEEVALTTKLAIEKHRSDQLLFGSLSQLSVPDLLQMAEASRRSGTVIFKHDGQTGTVWMSEGYVIGAEIEGLSKSEEAVYSIAVWADGTFEANFGDVDVAEDFRTLPSALLLEAMRRFDEESASTMPIPVQDLVETEVLDQALVFLNLVSGYALNHLHPRLVRKKIEQVRDTLLDEFPALAAFVFGDEGSVTIEASSIMGFEEMEIATAVGSLVAEVFRQLDSALTWRFTPQRLAKLLGPWREALSEFGFLEPLGIQEGEEEREDESHEADGVAGKPVPVGCLVLEPEGRVESFSSFGPRIGRIDPKVVIGRPLAGILPGGLASLTGRLLSQASDEEGGGLAVGREVIRAGHQEHVVRVAVVCLVSKNGFIVVINRLRDQRRSLTVEIERDPLTGALRDGKADRLLVANEDFLHAFRGIVLPRAFATVITSSCNASARSGVSDTPCAWNRWCRGTMKSPCARWNRRWRSNCCRRLSEYSGWAASRPISDIATPD